MNRWVAKSIELANSPGYLDKLTEIYPAIPSEREPLPESVKGRIKSLIQAGDYKGAIKLLIGLKEYPFPIEHPYISVLRAKPNLLEQNPLVVEQIGRILDSMGTNGIIRGCERPPDLNRQMGPRFRDWLKKYFSEKGFEFLPAYRFGGYNGKAFLDAGDTAISRYANENLGCKITRGRDLLVKVNNKYAIGEARFLSTVGGSQNRDVRETVTFAKDKVGNLAKIAVMDGMVWFDPGMLSVIKTLDDDEPGLSALLLEDFLDSLR